MMLGDSLGPYRILDKLGEGGMGEVYRARDTRLDRDVAIKVLPSALIEHADARARFEREAKAVAALSHPNILAIHDVGTEGPIAFAVTELLEGETLRSRLAAGALPARKTLDLALQIAHGLAAAHEKGIVHRDLKPENVFVTRDGRVKILDFGLAKLQTDIVAASATAAPTMPANTAPGLVLGTVGYMAPEQVRGQAVDHRADLFAFGAILYEMLAGGRAFKRDSAVETMNAILKEDPPEYPAGSGAVPPVLDRVVRRCLEKSPEERFQSARDLAFALQAISGVADSGSAAAVASGGARRTGRARSYVLGGLAGAALASIAAVALWLAWPAAETQPRRVARFTMDIPAGRTLGTFALSPDGSRLAYVGTENGQTRIYVRPLDQSADTPLSGTDGVTSLFFSPDGDWIGFFAAGRLRKIPTRGGDVVSIADAPFSGANNAMEPAGTWTDDGTIVFSVGGRGLSRVPASGGSPVSLTVPSGDRGDLLHMWPHVPRTGGAVMFTVSTAGDYDAASVDMVPLGGGTRTRAVASGARARLLETGHVIYAARAQLVAARFDTKSQTAAEAPVALVEYLGYRMKEPLFDVSAAGDLVYAEEAEPAASEVLRVDRHGRVEILKSGVSSWNATLSLSPDGTKLIGYRGTRERVFQLWMLDIPRGVLTRPPIDASHVPVWLPDGRTLAYSSDRAGPFNLFVQAADGSGTAERLTDSWLHEDPGTWSRDGRWLAYAAVASETSTDIWAYDRTAHRSVPVRQTEHNERFPALSPDGRWLAYASDESGREEVFVEAFPGGAGRVQLSGDGGTEPIWSASGQEIFYRNGSRLMSVTVEPGATLSASSPTVLFEGVFDPGASYGPPGYAVSPDGRSFYFLRTVQRAARPQRINVVLNWIEEFKQRVAK